MSLPNPGEEGEDASEPVSDPPSVPNPILDTLDWSVSGISALSGGTERHFQPSELSSQASSCFNSPRKQEPQQLRQQEENKGNKHCSWGTAAYQLGNTSSRMITEVKQR